MCVEACISERERGGGGGGGGYWSRTEWEKYPSFSWKESSDGVCLTEIEKQRNPARDQKILGFQEH